jgi:hypothetical protein
VPRPPDKSLDVAYRRARYRLPGFTAQQQGAAEPVLDLWIGRAEPRLRRLLSEHGAPHAALLTACNPRSVATSRVDNAAAMRALASAVRGAGYPSVESLATDPVGRWPDEPGLLIFGIGRDAALALARRFDQNALVWIDGAATPELLWVDLE